MVMKERPINMRAEEVRAILAGRKTQFRRVMRTQPLWVADPSVPFKTPDADPKGIINCPFGAPGDRLWVRECWAPHADMPRAAIYRCDPGGDYQDNSDGFRWRSSVHMPRKFSRITLEIVSVRVERLQGISEKDAKAEGVIETFRPAIDLMGLANNYYVEFARLWKSINGPEDWDENPWVRAVEFRRLEGAQ